jgi:hypothetical protein
MEEIFNIIGKLYIDVFQAHKAIESLQQKLKDKEEEIEQLKKLSQDS